MSSAFQGAPWDYVLVHVAQAAAAALMTHVTRGRGARARRGGGDSEEEMLNTAAFRGGARGARAHCLPCTRYVARSRAPTSYDSRATPRARASLRSVS